MVHIPDIQLSTNHYYYSLHFNGHCPDGSGLATTRMTPFWILLVLRTMEAVVTTGAIRRAKLRSNCHHQQTNTHFLQAADALPVTQPTVSEHWSIVRLTNARIIIIIIINWMYRAPYGRNFRGTCVVPNPHSLNDYIWNYQLRFVLLWN